MMTEPAPTSVCNGTISMIDIPNRALKVRLPAGQSVEMIAAPGCRVFLRGEAVRFRLLLAGDEVEVQFVPDDSLVKAISITVQARRGFQ
jgi:hypothetical protein